MEKVKDLNYWKNNCEEDYIATPISVLRYISELEKKVEQAVILPVVMQQSGQLVFDCKVCGKPFGDNLSLYYHYDEEHN